MQAEVIRTAVDEFVPPGRKPGSLHPFKRANALFQTVCDVYAQHSKNPIDLKIALEALPGYESRGHGYHGRLMQRTVLGKWKHDRSKYQPHQGRSECARRLATAAEPAL